VGRLVNLAGEIQKQFSDIAIVGTGYSWLRTLFANVAAASKAKGLATLIGAGRMAFAYPDFAKDIIAKGGLSPEKVCVGCSACTQIMRDGGTTGCVVRDNEVYGPIFEHGRMSDRDNLTRLASACRKCQEPTCQLACPAGVNIPGFISLFVEGKENEAYDVLREANVFPEVCAWLCPVEQQCQGGCLQGFIGDGPLPIADIQRYLAEQANRNGWSKLQIPAESTGRNAGIIGAGPAGLACAAKLLEAGHTVTIFDRSSEFGGMIESVIPADRQSDSLKNEVAAIFAEVPTERMRLRLGSELNADFNLDTIMAEGFDAAFVGMGLPEPVRTTDQKLDGLWNAMDFLAAAREPARLDLAGRSVAAIGGGNTAIDVALTAKRLGAGDVYVIYRRSFREMPAWSRERARAMAEGVHLLILTQPLGFNCKDGRLTGIRLCPTQLGPLDDSGRRRPQPIKSSCYDLKMDVVVEATGQKVTERIRGILPGVELKDGLVLTKEGSLATSRNAVFAGGDIIRGASTVVAAVADGMKAAAEIDEFLRRETKRGFRK
jgi:glutamate synthase (NADPH/NADH) small chain